MNTYHLLISGQVQGIGYRQFVKHHAKKLGVTGWVRNLPDNNVEARLQGEKEIIDKLISLCKKGPFMADIKDVVVTEIEEQETFPDFTIHPTPETI